MTLWQSTAPFLISKHFAVTSTFPTALTWAFGYHIRSLFFPNLLQDSPRMNSYTHSSMLRESAQLSLLNMKEENLYFRVTQTRAEILGPDDSPTTGSSVSPVLLPQNLAQEKAQDHQRQGCPRGHQTQYFIMFLGCGTRNNTFGASSGLSWQSWRLTLESSYHFSADWGGVGV